MQDARSRSMNSRTLSCADSVVPAPHSVGNVMPAVRPLPSMTWKSLKMIRPHTWSGAALRGVLIV
jgi:hypothetical protein